MAINKPDTASRLELYARAFGRIEAITADADPADLARAVLPGA